MKNLDVFFYEWKHFVRSPFKVVAFGLFVLAGVYGLHNGAKIYQEQYTEIEKIRSNIDEERQTYISYYNEGKIGPKDRPWVDLTSAYWALWYNAIHHFKSPSPAQVYSIGQAEQYGFYKRVTFWSGPYDADMAEEIANPERLQCGTLDFSFALLFLLPLLLIILLYNLKSLEAEQGFLALIEVQNASRNTWLVGRTIFYIALVFVVIVSLIVYGALLTDVFSSASTAFWQMLLYSFLYLMFWSIIYYFVLRSGTSIVSNTLIMVGIWIAAAFIIPAAVHQWVSLEKPANLMTELIDASRDKRQELFNLPPNVIQSQLNAMFPGIEESPVANDDAKSNLARNRSAVALVNELMKSSTKPIETDNHEKNKLISNTHWFNPISFFQNRFNAIAETHYDDYQMYRDEIQVLIDKQIRTMVLDTWNDVRVDKAKYVEYHELLGE